MSEEEAGGRKQRCYYGGDQGETNCWSPRFGRDRMDDGGDAFGACELVGRNGDVYLGRSFSRLILSSGIGAVQPGVKLFGIGKDPAALGSGNTMDR